MSEKVVTLTNENYENFINTDTDQDYMHMLYHFPINRFQFEHCRDYLDENGLFMGIFPPEFIENGINEWLKHQKELKEKSLKKAKEYLFEKFKEPLEEEMFIEFSNVGNIKDMIDYFLSYRLKREQEFYGKILYPLSYYNNYFQKYFGIEDIDEYLNNQHT